MTTFQEGRSTLRHPRLPAVFGLGFASGLPIALTSTTLQAWLRDYGFSIRDLGHVTILGLPYIIKVLWAPLLDRYAPPWFDRRRGWIVLTQALLALLIAGYAYLDPVHHRALVWGWVVVLALCSASQDIVVDAYRADLLPPAERGPGAASALWGYRIAMIISGSGALILADVAGWPRTFLVLAALMASTCLITWWAPRPSSPARPPGNVREAVLGPLREFLTRPQALWWLLLVIGYKLGDALALALSTPFLKSIGFANHQVGTVSKGFGLAATLAGVAIGAAVVRARGLYRGLLWMGLAQALTILAYAVQAHVGYDTRWLVVTIALQSIGDGMGTAAFMSLLAALCDARFSAFQYALFSALFALGRVVFAYSSGTVAEHVGWIGYFSICTLIGLAALGLVVHLRGALARLEQPAS